MDDASNDDVGVQDFLASTKTAFLDLCKLYERMGHMYGLQAKALSHPLFGKTSAPQTLQEILRLHQLVGEQLKLIGKGLDNLGGEPVLEPRNEEEAADTNE